MKIVQALKAVVFWLFWIVYVFGVRGEVSGALKVIMDMLLILAIASSLAVFILKKRA